MHNTIRLFLLIFFFSVFKVSCGQSRNPIVTRSYSNTGKNDIVDHTCIHEDKVSVQQRMKLYPFNKASRIQLVSFKNYDTGYLNFRVRIINGQVDYKRFKEKITLQKSDIGLLSDILFNYGYKGVYHLDYEGLCYNPRNAILFIDKRGKVFALIEICFQCKGYRFNSRDMKIEDFCEQKYDLLKTFFRKVGITYGVKK